jgi:hypothetical protein
LTSSKTIAAATRDQFFEVCNQRFRVATLERKQVIDVAQRASNDHKLQTAGSLAGAFLPKRPARSHGVAHTGGAAGSIVERTRQHSK